MPGSAAPPPPPPPSLFRVWSVLARFMHDALQSCEAPQRQLATPLGAPRAGCVLGAGCLQMASVGVLAVSVVMIVDNEGHIAYGDQVKNWGGRT